MPAYDHSKGATLDTNALEGHYADARERAVSLALRHREDGEDRKNPSTDVWRLTDAIAHGGSEQARLKAEDEDERIAELWRDA